MKVKELIVALQEYDEDMEVVYCSYYGYDPDFNDMEYFEDGSLDGGYEGEFLRIGSPSC